jgi:hypothetical protein
MALSDPDVVKTLNITSEQQDKIRTIREGAMEKLSGLSGAERRTKMQESMKEINDKTLAVLTPDQAAQFEKMKGAKVDFDLSTITRGGGRGGRGGPGGGGAGGGGAGGGGAGGGGAGGEGGGPPPN